MDRIGILCEKDREMMQEFSRRSIHSMNLRSLLSLTLSFFSGYLDSNVKKEVEKDRLIIQEAGSAFEAGVPICDVDLESIFEKTKALDTAFLERVAIPSFSIKIRYADIVDVRMGRIWLIARTVYALLKKWPDTASFSDAVKNTYTEEEFKKIIAEILHLYNLETRMLGDAVRAPFRKAITAYLEALYQAMESTGKELASLYSKNIFGDKPTHA